MSMDSCTSGNGCGCDLNNLEKKLHEERSTLPYWIGYVYRLFFVISILANSLIGAPLIYSTIIQFGILYIVFT